MKFPEIISNNVRREWSSDHGITGVIVKSKSFYHLLLDLTDVSLNPGSYSDLNAAKTIIALDFCVFLSNRCSRSVLLNNSDLNRYFDRDKLVKIVDSVTARALEIAEEEV